MNDGQQRGPDFQPGGSRPFPPGGPPNQDQSYPSNQQPYPGQPQQPSPQAPGRTHYGQHIPPAQVFETSQKRRGRGLWVGLAVAVVVVLATLGIYLALTWTEELSPLPPLDPGGESVLPGAHAAFLDDAYGNGATAVQVPQGRVLGISEDGGTIATWNRDLPDGSIPGATQVYPGLVLVDTGTAEIRETLDAHYCATVLVGNRAICSTGDVDEAGMVHEGTMRLVDIDVNTGETSFEVELPELRIWSMDVLGVAGDTIVVHVDHRVMAGDDDPVELIAIEDGELLWRSEIRGDTCLMFADEVKCKLYIGGEETMVEYVDLASGEVTETLSLEQDNIVQFTADGNLVASGPNEGDSGIRLLDRSGEVIEDGFISFYTVPSWRQLPPLAVATDELTLPDPMEKLDIKVLRPNGEVIVRAGRSLGSTLDTHEWHMVNGDDVWSWAGDPRAVTADGRTVAIMETSEEEEDTYAVHLVSLETGEVIESLPAVTQMAGGVSGGVLYERTFDYELYVYVPNR